jgi:hypothetical protein
MKKAAAEANHQDADHQDADHQEDGQVVVADQEVQGATDAENEDVEDRQEAVQDNG